MRAFIKTIHKFLGEADILLLVLSLICAIYGIVLISSVLNNSSTGSREIYVQIGAMVIGLVLFVIFTYIDIDIIADKSGLLYVFSILFISTLFRWGVGAEEVGSRGWLRFTAFGVQPVEVVKVPFMIIIAKMIVNYREHKSLNNFISILRILTATFSILVITYAASADVGNPLVYVLMLLTMLFIGGLNIRWFMLGAGLLTAMLPLIWNNFFKQYHRDRILAPFRPDLVDPTGKGVTWQPNISVRAISSGGFLGQGLKSGRITQSGLLAAQHTDFIFAAAGEELGFIGCVLIILLLVALIIRCIYIGAKSNSPLGMLVCTGVAAMLIGQMLLNIGMCLGILPVIGITLPFFSYGGSSIVVCFAAMGIVSGIKMRPKPVRFRSM